jgi:hypothetical protein
MDSLVFDWKFEKKISVIFELGESKPRAGMQSLLRKTRARLNLYL